MELRKIRGKLKIPIGEAARAIDISTTALSRIERREREPTGAVLLLIDDWVAKLRRERNLGPEFRVSWAYLLTQRRVRRRARRLARRRRIAAA